MPRAARYRLVDLFAGCGGMTRGFVDSGRYEPIFAVEMDEHAARTYSANFGGSHVEQRKIEDVDHFPAADVVVGGPPCQGFSPLNRDGVGFERRSLWQEYLRALRESQPAAFVMENVPQLLTSREYLAFKRAAQKTDPTTGSLGYRVEGRILNAADYGVPQRRRRAIVIGVRDGEVPWPEQTHWEPEKGIPLGGEPWRTFSDAVEGLPRTPSGEDWHIPRNPRPETLIRYRHVPHDGGNRFQMQAALEAKGLGHLVLPCWRNKPTGTTDVFGRLFWNRPAYTIRTEFYKPEKGRYLHPTEDRAITIREAARCMSFTDDFVFPSEEKWTEVARQIGNAVPPLLARRIAEAVAGALDRTRSAVGEVAA